MSCAYGPNCAAGNKGCEGCPRLSENSVGQPTTTYNQCNFTPPSSLPIFRHRFRKNISSVDHSTLTSRKSSSTTPHGKRQQDLRHLSCTFPQPGEISRTKNRPHWGVCLAVTSRTNTDCRRESFTPCNVIDLQPFVPETQTQPNGSPPHRLISRKVPMWA